MLPTKIYHALVLACLMSSTVLVAEPHNAAGEFDDFNNPSPSGWSYLNNDEILRSFVFNWNEPDFGPDQPGWEGPAGRPFAGWAQITDDNAILSGFDVEEGNLVTHGTTEIQFAPSVAAGDPASGSYTIAGGINNIRQLGRSGPWQLLHNNRVISSGEVSDDHTSADPSLFSDGCGGVDGIKSINYAAGDLITLRVLQNDFVNVDLSIETSASAGTDARACTIAPSGNPHIGYYRFEEAFDDEDIIDSVTGEVHGMLVNGATRSDEVPYAKVPLTGDANLRSADFTEAGHALMEGSQFVFNGPNAGGSSGDATLEWMIKVPLEDEIPNGHSAMIWTSSSGADADRFNIFWDASFTQAPDSDRFISGDFRSPGSAGPFDIGQHDNGNPLSEDEWHHIAIVRTDETPGNPEDSRFRWDWYIDGELSPSHFQTTDAATPLEDMAWRIAGRQGGDAVRAYFDEIRMTAAALSPDKFLIAVAPSIPGDFNRDGVLDVIDINMLVWESAGGAHNLDFDVTADGLVNTTDVKFWVKDLKTTWIGDSNLDGEFNSTDLVNIFQAGKFEKDEEANWTQGDWTGDHRFDSSDLVAAFQDGGFELGPANGTASVPEPNCGGFWILTCVVFWMRPKSMRGIR